MKVLCVTHHSTPPSTSCGTLSLSVCYFGWSRCSDCLILPDGFWSSFTAGASHADVERYPEHLYEMLRDVTKRPYLTPRGCERAGFAHADTHMQTCAHRANVCIQLPVAACIKFQILVLARETVRGSPVPSLPATIQQNLPASVLCPATTDPFCSPFFVLGRSALNMGSTVLSPGSQMKQ